MAASDKTRKSGIDAKLRLLRLRDVIEHFAGRRAQMKPLTLAFVDPHVEARYRAVQYRTFLPFQRIALVLGFLLYAGFGIADIYVIPDMVATAWIVRFAVVCPLIAGIMLLSFTPAFERLHQPILALMILIGSLGVDYMAVTAAPPGNYTYFVGSLIIVFYSFHFLRLDFVKALALAWISFAAYETGLLTSDLTPLSVAVANTFFFAATNLVAMQTGYLQEFLIRRDFLQQNRLAEGRRQLDSMAANVPGAVFRMVRHRDGHISLPYIGDGMREFFDRDPAELRAAPRAWLTWLHPDDRAAWRAAFRGAVENGEPFEAVVRMIGDSGRVKWMRTVGRAHHERNGDVVWDGICLDVTELKDREDQLRQAMKMEAVGRLTGGVAHDFNNLLTAIIGNLELMRDQVTDNPALLRCVESALLAADRSAELTGRLLAFSRKQPLAPRATDINKLVREVADLIRPSLNDTITLELMSDHDAWPAVIDPGQLESALLNLAVNAIDAMPDGGRLRFSTENLIVDAPIDVPGGTIAPGDYVVAMVADTGVGMPEEVAAQVFEPFFTTKAVGKGSGLGLSMVYGFVQQSGGQVMLETAPDEGTAISLCLPRALADVVREIPADVRSELRGEPLPIGSERVLVVENEVAVRDFICRTLTSLGYRVVDVRDARAALALAARGLLPEVLLANVGQPGGIDRPELVRRLRQRAPGMVAIVMTANDRDAAVVRGSGGAIDAVLQKPFNRQELAVCIRRQLDAPARRRVEPAGGVTVTT